MTRTLCLGYRFIMFQNAEILFEGSYLYYEKDVNYSQESFKLVSFPEDQSYHLYSEILSRIQTGEFLKILVRLEMNNQYNPNFLRIEKSIGNKYAEETYHYDGKSQELLYTFKTSQSSREFKRPFGVKHHLTTPSFASTAFFTLNKKFNATGRTPITVISSANDWSYEEPPVEHVIYAEFVTREMKDFQLNNANLPAAHLQIFEHDSAAAENDIPADLYISKHHAIPYLLVQGDRKIMIKHLKKI